MTYQGIDTASRLTAAQSVYFTLYQMITLPLKWELEG